MRSAALTMDFPKRSLPALAPAKLPQSTSPDDEHYSPKVAQEAYDLHGVDVAFAFTSQTQLTGEPIATEIQALHPHSASTVFPSHEQYDTELAGNSQSESAMASAAPVASASMMRPPRKRKAPTLRAHDWEPYKDRILELHLTQGLPLPEVRQIIEGECGFKAEYGPRVRAA